MQTRSSHLGPDERRDFPVPPSPQSLGDIFLYIYVCVCACVRLYKNVCVCVSICTCSLCTSQLEPSQAGKLFATWGEVVGVQGEGIDLSIALDTRNHCSHGHPQKFRTSLSALLFYLLIVKVESFGVWCVWGFLFVFF